MNPKRIRIAFGFAFIMLLPTTVIGQIDFFNSKDLSNIQVKEISNEELLNLYQKGLDYGFSKDALFQMARIKGLPESEINLLQKRLETIVNLNSEKVVRESNATIINSNQTRFDTSLGKVPTITSPIDSSIFGSELFSTSSLAFEPNLRIPPPANYMLGPDDEVVITVYGYSERNYSLTVNEQGNIYIPNVGLIRVSGLTLEQATELITNKLASTIYTAIKTGQTKVHVTLGKIRSIRITVIGQAKKPGTYTVSSLSTLYNVLYLCGGPTNMGSYREIKVIRGNEERTSDLYDFLVYGNQKDNILLQEGDVIRIPYYESRVTLLGSIKKPAKYEILNNETFKNLLEYSGGFTDDAYRGEVSVERITDSTKKIIDLNSGEFASFAFKGSDIVLVRKLQEDYGNRLFITGAVLRPGPYELKTAMTIKDLIEKAGGLKADAYTSRALVYRYLPNKLPAIQSINLDSVFNAQVTYLLQNNDSVIIQSIFSFKNDETITVQGNVKNPLQMDWRKGMTLRDAIFNANGISDSGDSTNIEISRRISIPATGLEKHIEGEIINVDLTVSNSTDILLLPNDLIIIKEKPGYALQRTVYIKGEVISPGTYALERNGTNISDIIKRAGGFRASADSSSLSIKRPKKDLLSDEERTIFFKKILNLDEDSLSKNKTAQNELEKSFDLVSVDLKQVMSNPNSEENLQLEDGDIITVERMSNLVKVSGEVYFPTIVAYKPNKDLKYYLQQAGGLTPHSRKTGAVVRHPNGTVASVKQFLFFKSYPSVTPRSEIFVPAKERDNRRKLGATEWAVIVSALGILSNVVINVSK